MILEMHCHTAEHSSCSHASAAEIAQRNFDIGLHGTVLTDHHYLWPPEEIEELRRKLKVPNYYLILSGQEVTTPELGDVLVYGADVAIEKGTRLAIIRNRFPDAAIVWAHPYRHENIPTHDNLRHPLIDEGTGTPYTVKWEPCGPGLYPFRAVLEGTYVNQYGEIWIFNTDGTGSTTGDGGSPFTWSVDAGILKVVFPTGYAGWMYERSSSIYYPMSPTRIRWAFVEYTPTGDFYFYHGGMELTPQ